MSESNTTSARPPLSAADVALLLSDLTRWRLLREMAKGESLPMQVLAQRIGRSPEVTAKHVAVMRRMGVALVGYGRLNSLAPAYRPPAGGTTIDFGHCVLRLDSPLS